MKTMRDEELSAEDRAEILRKKQKYRELILSGKISLRHDQAARLLGPDCLYHLYSRRERDTRRTRKSRKSLTQADS